MKDPMKSIPFLPKIVPGVGWGRVEWSGVGVGGRVGWVMQGCSGVGCRVGHTRVGWGGVRWVM